MKLKKYIKYIILILIISCFMVTFAANFKLRTIEGDFLNGVLTKDKLISENVMFTDIDRDEINRDPGNYSLFDRFGDDISFIGYLGEKKISLNTINKIYSLFTGVSSKQGLRDNFNTIRTILFDSNDAGVNNIVYENRADIINNNSDPRYKAYKTAFMNAPRAGAANFWLGISKGINSFLRIFIFPEKLLNLFLDIYENTIFAGTNFDILKKLFLAMLALGIFLFSIKIIGGFLKFLKGSGFKAFLSYYVFNPLIAAVIIISFGLFPNIFVQTYRNIYDKFNQLIEHSIDEITMDNAVISGSQNVAEATVWYITVFDPWCRGTFNKPYEECYTPYSSIGVVYPVSHDDKNSATPEDPKSDCAGMIGDFYIKSASGDVRNYAALAYSCQSIYHIDTTTPELQNTGSWPCASTTFNNSLFYNDDFKWVDALMNISYKYLQPNEVADELADDCVPYNASSMESFALLSLYRTVLLMLPLFIASVSLICYFLISLFTYVKMVWYSLLYFFNPEQSNIVLHIKEFGSSFLDLAYAFIIKAIILFLFVKLYQGFVNNVILLICSIIFFLGSKCLTRMTRSVQQKIRNRIRQLGQKVQDAMDESKKKDTEDENSDDSDTEESNESEDTKDESDDEDTEESEETEDELDDEEETEESEDTEDESDEEDKSDETKNDNSNDSSDPSDE